MRTILGCRTSLLPFCLLLMISGCVTRRAVKQNAASKPAQSEIKPATLSDYIRIIYKLSSEASKQAEERSLLLSAAPELAPLVAQAEEDPTNTEARTRIVSEYMKIAPFTPTP